MKRDKRTHHLRLSFSEREWRLIEAMYETVFPEAYPNIFPSEKSMIPRQALLGVALAIVKRGFCPPLPTGVDIRSVTPQERQMRAQIENGGPDWIGGPGGARFDLP